GVERGAEEEPRQLRQLHRVRGVLHRMPFRQHRLPRPSRRVRREVHPRLSPARDLSDSRDCPSCTRPTALVSRDYPRSWRRIALVSRDYPGCWRRKALVSRDYPGCRRRMALVSRDYRGMGRRNTTHAGNTSYQRMADYDLIIVGGGPAGLAASPY